MGTALPWSESEDGMPLYAEWEERGDGGDQSSTLSTWISKSWRLTRGGGATSMLGGEYPSLASTRPAPQGSLHSVWFCRDVGNIPDPNPACKRLHVAALVCMAVQPVADAALAEHLLRPRSDQSCIGIFSMTTRTCNMKSWKMTWSSSCHGLMAKGVPSTVSMPSRTALSRCAESSKCTGKSPGS